jgi:hypothetical protein
MYPPVSEATTPIMKASTRPTPSSGSTSIAAKAADNGRYAQAKTDALMSRR